MSSTYSSNLRIELIGSGDQAGTWGTTTDNNFAYLLDTAIAGAVSVSVTTTPQALTGIQGATSSSALNQSVFATLKLTGGGVASAFTLYAPPAAKQYIIWNATSYVATVSNATTLNGTTATGGATITLAVGEKALVWSDATNFYKINAVTSVDVSGGTTGLTTSGGPVTTSGTITLGGTLIVGNGGTGATSFTSGALLKGAGTGAITVASAADIVGQIGSTAVTNATNATNSTNSTNATNATNATRITNSGGWNVTPSGTTLYFNYNGTNVGSLDSSGNFIVAGNVTAYGTV